MKVIGTVGHNGSGKDTVLKIVSNKISCPLISMGDIFRDIAKKEGLQPTRKNLTNIAKRYISKYGTSYFPNQVINRIKQINPKNVCVAGIRRVDDAKVLKKEYENNFILIHVKTDARIRFQRLVKRGEKRDPINYEDFLLQELSEEKTFNISKTITLADYVICNDKGLDELEINILKFLKGINIRPIQ